MISIVQRGAHLAHIAWVLVVGVLVFFALHAGAARAGGVQVDRAARCPQALVGRSDLGRVAFIDDGQLRVADLASCQVRTLVDGGAQPPVRWSADGRYLAFGDGSVISADGASLGRPLGRLARGWGSGSPGWVWSPTGHILAGVATAGGVLVGGPGIRTRRLLPRGWGASSIAWSPTGPTLAVSRSLYLRSSPPYHQEIWLLNLRSGVKTRLLQLNKRELAPPWLSGFSPDGRWLLTWEDSQNSASLAADGVPLVAVPVDGGKPVRIATGELMYGDFVSWCSGGELAYVLDNGGREVSLGDRINLGGPPPLWPTVTPADPAARARLSFISPSCSPAGKFMIAAAVGPQTPDLPFGHEHRTIWLLSETGGNWHPAEPSPPAGSTDELPMWSSDGRWIAFVRTTWNGSTGTGQLYLLDLGASYNGHARLVGAIVNLGQTGNYYGHYNWMSQVAWSSTNTQ